MSTQPYLVASSAFSSGDCLGGYPAQSPLSSAVALPTVDAIQCIDTLDSILPAGLQIDIEQRGSEFCVCIFVPTFLTLVPTPIMEWQRHVLLDNEFIAVGDERTVSLASLGIGEYYLRFRRVASGTGMGTLTLQTCSVTDAPWCRETTAMSDTSARYACLYLVVPESLPYVDLQHGVLGCYVAPASRVTQTIPNHETEPEGVVWTHDSHRIEPAPAGTYPVWIRISPRPMLLDRQDVVLRWPAGAEEERMRVVEIWNRRYDMTIPRYRLYAAHDGRTCGGDLVATSDTLPISYQLAPAPAGATRTYRMRLTTVTWFGHESPNAYLDQTITVDDQGRDVSRPPKPLVTEEVISGRVRLTMRVRQPVQGVRTIALLVTADDGVEHYVTLSGDMAQHITETYAWGAPYRVEVRAVDAELRESEPATVEGIAYYTLGESPEDATVRHGYYMCTVGQSDLFLTLNEPPLSFVGQRDGTDFFYDDALVMTVTDAIDLAPGWRIDNTSAANFGSASAVGKFYDDAGAGIFYVTNGATRFVKFDTAQKIVTVPAFAQPLDATYPFGGVAHTDQHGTCWLQAVYRGYRSWARIPLAGAIQILPIRQTAT